MNDIKTIKSLAHKLILQHNIGEDIKQFLQFEDKEFNKKYDVYYINTEKGKYIFKNCGLGHEGIIYELFSKYKVNCVPIYYGKIKDLNNNIWILLEYINGDTLTDKKLEDYSSAASELGELHSKFLNTEKELDIKSNIQKRIDRADRIIEKHNNGEIDWDEEIIRNLKFTAHRFENRPKTIIQDDLLPINIMTEQGKIKFIDWEYACIGCYSEDIGRLLGDFRNSRGKHWVNNQWEEQILRCYYKSICNNGLENLTWDEFMLDFQCSKLWNYADIVYSHIINDWECGEWYELNYKNMMFIAKNIKKIL